MGRIKYLLNLLIISTLLLTVAINRNGTILGFSADQIVRPNSENRQVPVESMTADGLRQIHSASLGKDLAGYGGYTPVRLVVRDGIVERVELEENNETEEYLQVALQGGVLDRWKGISVDQVAQSSVDAITGATLSSRAITHNIIMAARYAAQVSGQSSISYQWSISTIIGFIVILLGVSLTFYRPKQKWVRVAQLLANVVVLGVWCGAFLSLSQFVSWIANGFNYTHLLPIVMLAVILIMPLVQKRGVYCHAICPMGSLQELVGMLTKKKIALNKGVVRVLNRLSGLILSTLLLIMWLGVGFELMNYELFTAFLLGSASWIVLSLAFVFVILSLFIPRPYCRFVCPTGCLINLSTKVEF